MAYSRWSDSRWYTYWSSTSSGPTKLEKSFCICDDPNVEMHFTYADLRKDVDRCLVLVKGKHPTATKEEIEELKGYMEAFMKDVDRDFPEKSSRHRKMNVKEEIE